MPQLSLDRFHADPDNWVLGFLYFSRADRRLLVPKRIRSFGFTLNFARPMAIPFLLLLPAIALLPIESVMGPYERFGLLLKVAVILAMLTSANRLARIHQ